MNKLPVAFFDQNVVKVAEQLLGKTLNFFGYNGTITETEAYRGSDDEASHAFKGSTLRSSVMFGPSGYTYVYMIYGLHYCLNIVTETEGSASAVLIRGLKLPTINLNGPAKICKHLGITKQHNAIDLNTNESFYISEGLESVRFKTTPRIGISKATDKLWRFVIA